MQRLIQQAKARAAEMCEEFEKGKKALLASLEAEKENLHHPTVFTVKVVCLHGPYKKSEYTMTIDSVRSPLAMNGPLLRRAI